MNNKLNLSDNEKRDIIKYLESGKPLPEKYRFLLFDTDKEVELLWNGKTDEIENVVLPFQAIELYDFSVFYNQDNTGEVEEKLHSGGNKIIIENGQVIKISKDKQTDIIEKEVLTKKWTDWIDYWSVDFEFESKKEIVRLRKATADKSALFNEQDDEWEEKWTGNYIFENEWQSFRTKKDRSLELTSAFKDAQKGKMKIAVKVIDIFGNDTTKVVEITI